jgi:hypothetical protein
VQVCDVIVVPVEDAAMVARLITIAVDTVDARNAGGFRLSARLQVLRDVLAAAEAQPLQGGLIDTPTCPAADNSGHECADIGPGGAPLAHAAPPLGSELLADRLGVSARSVVRWAGAGESFGRRVSGAWVFTEDEARLLADCHGRHLRPADA